LTPASFTPLALNDMKEAFEFYEAKDHELALKFILCIRQTVDAIEKGPLRFPVVFENVRKARVAKFPFVVSYVTDGESIIIACLHDRRNPKVLMDRLRALGPSLQ
jgi:plasmid stabilization system protein ParE